MSFRFQRSRPDASTQQIVDELRALGYTVEYHGKADLLVTHPSWPLNTWRKLECKSPKGKNGTLRLRTDQQEQQDYCAQHGIPYVLDGLQALTYLRQVAP